MGSGCFATWAIISSWLLRCLSKRSSKTAPLPSLSSKSAYASAGCVTTIKRFARQAGFSSPVAGLLAFCRRKSTHLNYRTESAANPLPHSVIVPSLSNFVSNLPEGVQCPVRAIKFLRKAAPSASYIPSRLFVSPRNPERAMSMNAISFYLRQLITDSGAVSSSRPPRAHDVRGNATSLNYYSIFSLSHLMQVATWKSNRNI